MQRHSGKCNTQDSTASLQSSACNNYELLSIIFWMRHARFNYFAFSYYPFFLCCKYYMGPIHALVPMGMVYSKYDNID